MEINLLANIMDNLHVRAVNHSSSDQLDEILIILAGETGKLSNLDQNHTKTNPRPTHIHIKPKSNLVITIQIVSNRPASS